MLCLLLVCSAAAVAAAAHTCGLTTRHGQVTRWMTESVMLPIMAFFMAFRPRDAAQHRQRRACFKGSLREETAAVVEQLRWRRCCCHLGRFMQTAGSCSCRPWHMVVLCTKPGPSLLLLVGAASRQAMQAVQAASLALTQHQDVCLLLVGNVHQQLHSITLHGEASTAACV
jgi:hypothetical protein